MRNLFTIFILLSLLHANGQESVTGLYFHDKLGSSNQLLINPDFTFIAGSRSDLRYTWAKGSWVFKSDTLEFKYVPIFDTLIEYSSAKVETRKSLIISCDETSNSIALFENDPKMEAKKFELEMCCYEQNSKLFPNKLLYSKNKLFRVDMNELPIKENVGLVKARNKPRILYRRVKK